MLAFPSAAELNLSKQSASVFSFHRIHVKFPFSLKIPLNIAFPPLIIPSYYHHITIIIPLYYHKIWYFNGFYIVSLLDLYGIYYLPRARTQSFCFEHGKHEERRLIFVKPTLFMYFFPFFSFVWIKICTFTPNSK